MWRETKNPSVNCFWCFKASANRITMREVLHVFGFRRARIFCARNGNLPFDISSHSVWVSVCLGMDEFNMIMSSCQPYIRSAHRCSRSAILRFNDVGIWQNDARDAEMMAVSWLLFTLVYFLLGYVNASTTACNMYCVRMWCRCVYVCAYWDYVLKYLLKDKVMKFRNISNDIICSIENKNELRSTQAGWRQPSVSDAHTRTHRDDKVARKATATTAHHSKSNYGIHFSSMLSVYMNDIKYQRLLSFSGEKFLFLYSYYVHDVVLVMWAVASMCWHCIDAGFSIRSEPLTRHNTEQCVHSHRCKRCATALKCIKIFSASCSVCLCVRHVNWLARTTYTDRMSLKGITENHYIALEGWTIFNSMHTKPYFARNTYHNSNVCECVCEWRSKWHLSSRISLNTSVMSVNTQTYNLLLPTFMMTPFHLTSFREFDRLYHINFSCHTSQFDCWISI